ncbi:MAG: outer membrane protein [Geminicoccaceae bacterium]
MLRFPCLLVAGALAFASPASAQETGPLSGLSLGFVAGASFFFDQSFENGGANFDLKYNVPGYVIGGQVGYQIATNVRLEAEVSYAATDAEVDASVLGIQVASNNFDISTLNLTTGAYLDLWPIWVLVPYVGGGLGYSFATVDINGSLPEQDQNNFMLYGEAGVPYQVVPNFSIVPSVRFNWILTEEEVGNGNLFSEDLYTTELRLGARYHF